RGGGGGGGGGGCAGPAASIGRPLPEGGRARDSFWQTPHGSGLARAVPASSRTATGGGRGPGGAAAPATGPAGAERAGGPPADGWARPGLASARLPRTPRITAPTTAPRIRVTP